MARVIIRRQRVEFLISERFMDNQVKIYHRRGEPGGPGCPVSVLPVQSRDAEGNLHSCVLLAAGIEAGELELLRTIAARLGAKWGKDDLGWWAALARPDFPSWSVWRQDDNGNRFLLRANLTKEEAPRVIQHFESLGHKQHYWAEDSSLVSGGEG